MPPRTYTKTFLPLESNPEVFTSLAHDLGLSSVLKFTEFYDLDVTSEEEVLAYVLAFPTDEGYDERIAERDGEGKEGEREEVNTVEGEVRGEINGLNKALWLRQTIHNACGLYALLHATCNGAARQHISISPLALSSFLPSLTST
jgi:ubiquitin carboxyl-terminal hydrolase L3